MRDLHERTSHGGLYCVLAEFRKFFYVQHCFSALKRILKGCVLCKKLHGRTMQLTQNAYREFRMNPPQVPYRSIFCDFLGPFSVKYTGEKRKVYLLLITCLWSRSINLKICTDLSLPNFLRSLSLHNMEHGCPQLILSDSGSQLVAAGKLLNDYLNDDACREYLSES